MLWLALAATFCASGLLVAQFGFGFGGGGGDSPLEITADGGTRFEGGLAIAEENVQIHYGDYSIYADYAEYNPETRDVLLVGNIRLYTPNEIINSQRILFNLDTKRMQTLEVAGEHSPMFFSAFALNAMSPREFHIKDATLTTDDSSIPNWHVRAKSVRIYTDSRVVFVNPTVYVGETPVFWLPAMWVNIDSSGFDLVPGYDS